MQKNFYKEQIKEKTICHKQAGGQPGQSTIDMAAQTVLIFEVSRLLLLIVAQMFLDAKACYNRIVISLSNMVCWSQGLNKKITKLYTQTLEQMKHYPKHKLGILKTPNGHNKPNPFHGMIQGSQDGGTQ